MAERQNYGAQNNNRSQKDEAVKKKLNSLINNRMGISPDCCVFTVRRDGIEKVVENLLATNGVTEVNDEDLLIIRAMWNSEYDPFIKGKANPHGVVPFKVFVAVKRASNNKRRGNGLIGKVNRLLDSNTTRIQFNLINADKLNAVVSTLCKKSGNKNKAPKIPWEIDKKKADWAYVELDTYKILDLIFCDEGRKNVIYDFLRRHVNNSSGDFSFTVLKTFKKDNYKNRQGDRLAFLARA